MYGILRDDRGGDRVNVLCMDISGLDEMDHQRLYQEASEDRKRRADRYPRLEDKLRCVAADSLLKRAVKDHLHLDRYTVETDELGKPRLKDVEGFHFNLSHSGRWVVLAYGNAPVGIDVQEVRRTGIEEIARRFFTPDEQAYVFEGTEQIRQERFLRVWTGKESYLKYLGTGIRKALDSFSIFDDLGVVFQTTMLDGACMTVCSQQL